MSNFMLEFLKITFIFILDFIFIVGIMAVGYFIFYDTIHKYNDTLYTFILGCLSGIFGGIIMYFIKDIIKYIK